MCTTLKKNKIKLEKDNSLISQGAQFKINYVKDLRVTTYLLIAYSVPGTMLSSTGDTKMNQLRHTKRRANNYIQIQYSPQILSNKSNFLYTVAFSFSTILSEKN